MLIMEVISVKVLVVGLVGQEHASPLIPQERIAGDQYGNKVTLRGKCCGHRDEWDECCHNWWLNWWHICYVPQVLDVRDTMLGSSIATVHCNYWYVYVEVQV